MINLQMLLFWLFSAILLFSAIMVIFSRHPVRGILFLVLSFVVSSCLWLMLQAEFLALVLIFVYVGAVMTLFLFVVMMLNIDLAPLREGFVRYLPLGLVLTLVIVGLVAYVLTPQHFPFGADAQLIKQPATYS